MPGDKTVNHPIESSLSITFNEEKHLYIDSEDKKYVSVTTLIGKAFPKFDSESIAKKVAAKKGCDYRELMKKWELLGESARNHGTRLHEICEATILHNPLPHKPVDPNELLNFKLGISKCKQFLEDPTIEKLQPELLVFSPKLLLAGSIDLLVKYDDMHYHIYDWKNLSKPISKAGYEHGIVEATKNLPDSNYWHYALQLQLYELLLKVEGYIDIKAEVNHTLLVFCDNELTEVPLEKLMNEAKELVKWNLKETNGKL